MSGARTERPLRVFVAGLAHETNSFSPIPTARRSFEQSFLIEPHTLDAAGLAAARPRLDTFTGYGTFLREAERRGHQVHCGLAAFAMPSAPARREVYEDLRTSLLADLEAADRVDAALLMLHGAQVAEGYPDCAGDILLHVRRAVGPDVPVGVLLDLHGHVTPAMAAHADVLLACLEYPHTDFETRAAQLVDLIEARALGGAPLQTIVRPLPMLAMHHTTREPMRALVQSARAAEGYDGIRAVSLLHGFPWADTPHTCAAVVVVADPGTSAAAALAARLASAFFAQRGELATRLLAPDAALDCAVSGPHPAVIADFSDNPGGGAACDSTFLLRRMLERGVRRAGLGILWDPLAVQLAHDAGPGARLALRLGGKTGPLSGAPLDVVATVRGLDDDVRQGGFFERSGVPAGGALLDVEGIAVVVSGRRQQIVSPEAFTQFGVDPGTLDVIVLKSSQHFHAAFAPIAAQVLYANPPGSLGYDFTSLPYRSLTRPCWPLDPIVSA